MKELIVQGRIEVLGGVNKSWKEFDVKLPGGQVESANIESNVANNQ
jgi:hypothetical protein